MNFELRIRLPMPQGLSEVGQDDDQQATAQSFSVEVTTRDTFTYKALDFDRIFDLLNSVEDWRDLGPQFAFAGVSWVNLLYPDGKFDTLESRVGKPLAKWLQNLAEENSPLYQVALILMQPLVKHAIAYSDLMCKDQKEQLSRTERQRLNTLLEVFSTLEGSTKRPLFQQIESLAHDEIRINRTEVGLRAMRIWTIAFELAKCADLLDWNEMQKALGEFRHGRLMRNLSANSFPHCARNDPKIRRKYYDQTTGELILERNRGGRRSRRKQGWDF